MFLKKAIYENTNFPLSGSKCQNIYLLESGKWKQMEDNEFVLGLTKYKEKQFGRVNRILYFRERTWKVAPSLDPRSHTTARNTNLSCKMKHSHQKQKPTIFFVCLFPPSHLPSFLPPCFVVVGDGGGATEYVLQITGWHCYINTESSLMPS